jgi:predicted acyl esterase
MGGRLRAVLVAASLLTGACTAAGEDADPDPGPRPVPEEATAPWAVQPSVEQLIVADAGDGQELSVLDGTGAVVAKVVADDQGNAIVRELPPGAGYRVVDAEDPDVTSAATEVWAVEDVPDPTFYEDQELVEGFQYLETRDGTLLAVNVTLPGPIEDGPYPTVVEYSGYSPADPDALQPLLSVADLLGYATVGVNMRGTGCSGGSFLFFEPAQWTDGYDAIEAIAAQPWSTGQVGMVGISYPGISQLFVAQTQPPSLAAITPLSVIDDTYRSTLYPGGILNDGFATSWAEERQRDGAALGQAWAEKRADEGDRVCAENQAYRTQNPDLFEFIEASEFVPEDRTGYVGRLAPSEWVDRIEVPVFLAGAWQDEQTGGHFPAMLDRFTGSPLTRVLLTNGGHTDALSPDVLVAMTEFLDLYVAERIPSLPDGIDGALGLLGNAVFGVQLDPPTERFADATSYEEARREYEAEPPVRVFFEHGSRPGQPGAPYPGFSVGFSGWPIPETEATTWHLGLGGTLTTEAPDEEALEEYEYDTSRSQVNTLAEDGNPWTALPEWRWEAPAEGTALAYASDPLEEDLVMAGPGRVDLWLGSTAPDVDVQVTLSEIRPDGTEVYVQNGWLRASHRRLDEERTTPLQPYHTHLEADAEPLPEGELAEVNVELFPFAHVFRSGSRLRLVIDAPGGTRPEWRFDVVDAPAGTVNRVGLGGATPSRVTLPVIDLDVIPADPPPCPSLRGQPCRPLAELANRPLR